MPHTEDCKEYVFNQLIDESDRKYHSEYSGAYGDKVYQSLCFGRKFCAGGIKHSLQEFVPHHEKAVHVLPLKKFYYAGNENCKE